MSDSANIELLRKNARGICEAIDGASKHLLGAAKMLAAAAEACGSPTHRELSVAADDAKVGLDRLTAAIRRTVDHVEAMGTEP